MSAKNIIQSTIIAAAVFAAGIYAVDHFKLLEHAKTNDNVESTVKKIIEDNPELMVKTIENWHYNKIAAMQQEKQKALSEKGNEFKQDAISPMLGNKDGKIVIVEFFDYLCGYCKKVAKTVDNVIANHPDVKVILKPVPIMGSLSSFIEKAAIAVYMNYPDKFVAFDKALYQTQISSENDVIKLAINQGIDGDKLKIAISRPEVAEVLENNIKQAQEIGVSGTPAFIINNQLLPGALDEATFNDLIKKSGGSSANTAANNHPKAVALPSATPDNAIQTVEIPVSVKPNPTAMQPSTNNQPIANEVPTAAPTPPQPVVNPQVASPNNAPLPAANK